jgi:hypothetical protein
MQDARRQHTTHLTCNTSTQQVPMQRQRCVEHAAITGTSWHERFANCHLLAMLLSVHNMQGEGCCGCTLAHLFLL